MKRTSICIVSHNSYGALHGADAGHIGGIEKQTYLIANWLTGRGHLVSVITWQEGPSNDEIIDGILVIKVCRQSAGLPKLRFFHPRWTALASALKKADAEVYYHFGAEAFTGQISHWCLMKRRRFVFSVASDADCDLRSRFFGSEFEWNFYKYGLMRADCVIAQSRQQSEKLLENFTRRSEVLSMAGAGPVEYSGISLLDGKSRVLWVGRIYKVKRPDRLLDIAQQCPDIQFDVVGPLGDDESSRSFSENVRSFSNVTVHGCKSPQGLEELYESSSLLCCTSETEGFPNTFLEAWSYGRPVFTTFDPDSVIERNGLGMAAQDVRVLGNGIAGVLSDRQRLKRLGDNAREYFLAHHSTQVVLPKFEALLLGQAVTDPH